MCLATKVSNQTLEDPFDMRVGIALRTGASSTALGRSDHPDGVLRVFSQGSASNVGLGKTVEAAIAVT